MSQDDRYKDITLEDVDTCITVLERFIQRARRAESVLSRLRSYQPAYGGGGNIFNMQDVVKEVMSQQRKGVSAESPAQTEEGVLTEEEVRDMKAVADKVKVKARQEPTK